MEEVAQGECESGVSGRSGGSKKGSIKRSVSGGSTERAERVEQAEKRREREESEDKTGSAGRAELEREVDGEEAAEGRREQWRGG